MYGHAIGQSPVIDGLLRDMRLKLNMEVRQSMMALRISGMVGMLVQSTDQRVDDMVKSLNNSQ